MKIEILKLRRSSKKPIDWYYEGLSKRYFLFELGIFNRALRFSIERKEKEKDNLGNGTDTYTGIT